MDEQSVAQLKDRIFGIRSTAEFDAVALDVFRYQAVHCKVYSRFLQLLGVHADEVTDPARIPYLPVEAFRDNLVLCEGLTPQTVFRSSMTTGAVPAQHAVADLTLYDRSLTEGFRLFYGSPGDYAILALLPTYLERPDASLVYMVRRLMEQSGHPLNGFFIHEMDELNSRLKDLLRRGERFMLLGVTFALMDFSERFPVSLGTNILVETGGMKGRRKELVREELHALLCSRMGVETVHSEYGMTELLSQAWSKGSGIYHSVPWMRIGVADPNDPLQPLGRSDTGVIRVADLANLHSCSFIATQDIGRLYPDGGFEVLGRIDQSELRGCNLMTL